MSERFKYSLNGVYRCEHFAQNLAANNFPTERIGSAGGFDDWFIQLKTNKLNNQTVVIPWIYSATFNKKLGVKRLFCVLKKDGTTCFFRKQYALLDVNHGPCGLNMDILELLNEKNGYLDDEALTIEYGIQVESILGNDKIWRFNTKDPMFGCEEKKNMIQIHNIVNLTDSYVHKQLLIFHSSYFESWCNEGNFKESILDETWFEDLENFLQICQGVHVKHLNVRSLANVMNIAVTYSFPNVIRYCDRQIVENYLMFTRMKSWVIHCDGLRHYLVHLLKNVKSPKEMIDENDIEEMEGETMKMFVAKFLYNKF